MKLRCRWVVPSLFVNDTLISPCIEALTMLAALAPATERATLGRRLRLTRDKRFQLPDTAGPVSTAASSDGLVW
jgi:hypothetical protein